ncbi:hypothetical protein F5Y10DRAFT_294290 [Nemania abortiva]|nr:hypothetical protein F5Y10DRAFT_294290 [Nemania abortiva]
MSITLTISRSGLKLSRHRAAVESSEVDNKKPDITSLEDFASKLGFQRRQNKTAEIADTRRAGEALKGDAKSELIRPEPVVSPAGSPLDGPSEESSTLKVAEPVLNLPPQQPAGTTTLFTNADSYSSNGANEDDTATNRSISLKTPSITVTTASSGTTGAESIHTDLTKPDGVCGEDAGECSSTWQTTNDGQTKPHLAVEQSVIQISERASGSSGVSPKGKEVVRPPRWKPAKVHIPRNKLDILRKIRTAGPETVSIEDTVFSAVHHEKLRRFLGVLGSKKDQIELFGKELPRCRGYLVRVLEGTAESAPYICIQGLTNAADITRIHSAMSHKRYKTLYEPLRLCYETSDLSYVSNPESSEKSQSSSYSTPRVGLGFTPGLLSPIPEGSPPLYPDTGIQTFYEYLPVANDRTYCGSLSRTLDNGKAVISTFGGLVEVDGVTYLMTCQHGLFEPSASVISSLSDTIVESDIPDNVERPLVFCSGNLYDGSDDPDHSNQSRTGTRLASLETFAEPSWKSLSVQGGIRKGREWSLVPMGVQSILPNFVERPSSKKGKNIDEPEILYLDQIAEPNPGHGTYIAHACCSGVVSSNTSFMFGGGMEGVLEVWKLIMDDEKGLRKGDSGSWVLDTSDPLQYKVIGSVIATSDRAAHFVSIQDQFLEMVGDATKSSRASLAPVFWSLVQCAQMAYKRDDFKSGNWFIDQALSGRALEQMHSGWYLPTIKALLGIIDDDSNITPRVNTDPQPIVKNLRALLRRYGVEILDATVMCHEWLQKRDLELYDEEKWILEELVAAAESFDNGESKGLSELPDSKKLSELPKTEPRTELGPDCIPFHEIIRRSSLIRTVEQSGQPAPPAPPAPPTHTRRGGPPPAHTRRGGPPPAHIRRPNDGVAVGFLVKKNSAISRSYLLLVPLMVAFASLSGIAAAMVLRDAERGTRISFFHVDTGKAAGIGAVFGIISIIPLVLQILILYVSHNFDWYLYLGRHVLSSPLHRKNSGIGWFVISAFIAKVLLIIASSFARSTLTAQFLAQSLGVSNIHPLIVASTAASGPLIISTASPILFWNIVSAPAFDVKESWVLVSAWWLTATGFDALAGYTFGKITQNQGLDTIQPRSGAASFGVFGALANLSFFLSFILLWTLYLRKKSHSGHALDVPDRLRIDLLDDHASSSARAITRPVTPSQTPGNPVEMAPAPGHSLKASNPRLGAVPTPFLRLMVPSDDSHRWPASMSDSSTVYTGTTSYSGSTAYTGSSRYSVSRNRSATLNHNTIKR